MEKYICDEIKRLMAENGLTYREVAKEMGCTYQNVWERLNNRPNVAFCSLRKILNAFGYDFDLVALEPGALDAVDQAAFFEAMEEKELPFTSASDLLAAMKVGINIVEKSSKKKLKKHKYPC